MKIALFAAAVIYLVGLAVAVGSQAFIPWAARKDTMDRRLWWTLPRTGLLIMGWPISLCVSIARALRSP